MICNAKLKATVSQTAQICMIYFMNKLILFHLHENTTNIIKYKELALPQLQQAALKERENNSAY